jgi:hypothetical protein
MLIQKLYESRPKHYVSQFSYLLTKLRYTKSHSNDPVTTFTALEFVSLMKLYTPLTVSFLFLPNNPRFCVPQRLAIAKQLYQAQKGIRP